MKNLIYIKTEENNSGKYKKKCKLYFKKLFQRKLMP